MTKDLPTKNGHYWWVQKFDGYVSAKEVLEVKEYQGVFYASGGEYNFEVKMPVLTDDEIDEEYWQYIPEPEIP